MKRLSAALTAALACAGSALPADDAQPKPENLYSQLDKDANGQLSKDEVPENQVRFFERLVRVGDKNDDGELTRDEFIAAMEAPEIKSQTRPAEGGPGAAGGPGGRMGMNPEEMFRLTDRNGDGKISRSELPERAAERMGQLFDRLGKDELTKEEFLRGAERFAGGPPGGGAPGSGRPGMAGRMGEEMLARMKSLDTNKDGKVTLEEAPEGEARTRVQQILDRTGGDAVDLEQFGRMLAQREGGGRPEGAPGDRPRPEGDRPDGDRPRPEGERPDGDRPRPEGERPEGDRPRPEGERPDGERPRPEGARPDVERPRPEGDRPRPEGDRPRPEGERPEGDRPRPEGEGFRFVPPILGALDANRDGRISQEEAASFSKKFADLDRNGDGQLDRAELMGFPPGGGPMMRDGEGGRPPFGPRDGEGPPREGFRPPQEGDRRPGEGARPPREGEGRPPEGGRPPREGDEDRPRPRPEGDQPREGDRPEREQDRI